MFPFSINGTVTVNPPAGRPVSHHAIIGILGEGLKQVRASHISEHETGLHFSVNFFRWVTKWNLLNSFREGTIDVSCTGTVISARYRVWLRIDLLVVPAIIVAVFLLNTPIRVAPVVFLAVVVCGTYGAAAVRFRSFVRRTMQDAFDEGTRLSQTA